MKYAADTEVLEREVRTLRRDHRLIEDALRHAEVERDRYREALVCVREFAEQALTAGDDAFISARYVLDLTAAPFDGQTASTAGPSVTTRRSVVTAACCGRMADELAYSCPTHSPRAACPDTLIEQLPDGTIGIVIHDGGSSISTIDYCPWCAAPLRDEAAQSATAIAPREQP